MQIPPSPSTHLVKTLSNGVSEGPPASHDNRGFVVRLPGRPLTLSESSLGPTAVRIHLIPVNRHGHGDDQGHHAGLSARDSVLLLRHKNQTKHDEQLKTRGSEEGRRSEWEKRRREREKQKEEGG